MIWVWGIFTAIALILEFITTGLISVWFAAGGFVTLLVVAIWPSLPIIWQCVIFVFVSCVLLFLTRKIFKKISKETSETKTNINSAIGKQFKIKEVRPDGKIYYRMADVDWQIIEDDEEELKVNDLVEIVKIKGNKLVVNKIKKGDK